MRKSGSPGRLHSGKEHSPIHTREPNLSTGVGEQMSPSTFVEKAPDGEATQDSRPNGLKGANGKFRKLCWDVLSILKGPWWEWSKKPPKCQPRCSATLPNGPGQVVPYITTTPKNQFWERKCLRSKSSKRWTQQPRECTNTRWSSGSKVC